MVGFMNRERAGGDEAGRVRHILQPHSPTALDQGREHLGNRLEAVRRSSSIATRHGAAAGAGAWQTASVCHNGDADLFHRACPWTSQPRRPRASLP